MGRSAASRPPADLHHRNPVGALFQDKRLWASENLESFIIFRPSRPQENNTENSNAKRSSFKGSDQDVLQRLKRLDPGVSISQSAFHRLAPCKGVMHFLSQDRFDLDVLGNGRPLPYIQQTPL